MIILFNRDIFLAYYVANPIRCQMWQDQNIKVFLTPEEWRSLSGVKESLKETKWVDGGILLDYENKKYFDIDGDKYYFMEFNREYPNINTYIYEDLNFSDGYIKNTIILYDHKLEKKIVQYRLLKGTYIFPLLGNPRALHCENEEYFEKLIYGYLN